MIELNERTGYGDTPYSAQTLAHMFDDELRGFSQYLAVICYFDNLNSTYAQARDLAPSRHGRYSPRRIQHFRREVLTNGLDLSTIGEDAGEIWSARWRAWAGIQVSGSEPHGLPDGVRRREDFDLIKDLGKRRKQQLKALRAVDTAYREALVTAASLGSSVEAGRMGRRALIVAAASLAVAVVTLLLANTGGGTLWSDLLERIRD